jgi:hypothetical protein
MRTRLPPLLVATCLTLTACDNARSTAEDALELRGITVTELAPSGPPDSFRFVGTREDHDCSGTARVVPHSPTDEVELVFECLPPAGAQTTSLPEGAEIEVVNMARRCDGGVADGCASLALAYLDGEGVRQDKARAAMLFTQACASHSPVGCFQLAEFLEATGTAKPAELSELWVQACDLDHAVACGKAAQALYNADEQTQIPTMARMARKGCDLDDNQACLVLGILHAYGVGMPLDMPEARKRLMQACSGGMENACTLVESL